MFFFSRIELFDKKKCIYLCVCNEKVLIMGNETSNTDDQSMKNENDVTPQINVKVDNH